MESHGKPFCTLFLSWKLRETCIFLFGKVRENSVFALEILYEMFFFCHVDSHGKLFLSGRFREKYLLFGKVVEKFFFWIGNSENVYFVIYSQGKQYLFLGKSVKTGFVLKILKFFLHG